MSSLRAAFVLNFRLRLRSLRGTKANRPLWRGNRFSALDNSFFRRARKNWTERIPGSTIYHAATGSPDVLSSDGCGRYPIRVARKGYFRSTGENTPADSGNLVNYLRHEGLMVSTVFLSHLDEDHAGGVLGLVNPEIRIGCVISAEASSNGEAAEPVQRAWKLLAERGIPLKIATAGDSF